VGDPRGFLRFSREKASARPIDERLRDWGEFEALPAEAALRQQAARCMDCGIPFCHRGCPLGNLIPEFNDAVYRGDLPAARAALEATNNFPEITGRVCPAPCEASCVLSLHEAPVTIKDVERAIADGALDLPPRRPPSRTGRRVAVVGSGPAGLAAAQQLARRGHEVTVFERDPHPGGLLRYGIPDFKLAKATLDRRLDQLRAEGVIFVTGAAVGVSPRGGELRRSFDAVIVCVGAGRPRDLEVPGRELAGIHFAMAFLTEQNRRVAGDGPPPGGPLWAEGKRVIVVGGGDTGSDCLGTALRQGAASVQQLELMPAPPLRRLPENPWPEWPLVLRTSSSQEEGGERQFAVQTLGFVGNDRGEVRGLRALRLDPSGAAAGEIVLPCELVFLAAGFVGVEASPLWSQLGLEPDARGRIAADPHGHTSQPGIFAAGDATRGASLVVWAIAEGRRVAESVDAYLKSVRAALATAAALPGKRRAGATAPRKSVTAPPPRALLGSKLPFSARALAELLRAPPAAPRVPPKPLRFGSGAPREPSATLRSRTRRFRESRNRLRFHAQTFPRGARSFVAPARDFVDHARSFAGERAASSQRRKPSSGGREAGRKGARRVVAQPLRLVERARPLAGVTNLGTSSSRRG
jgi:glutamate synthase (NADPH) small chain